MKVFQDYAYYYNAFYKDKDYEGEAGQVDRLLRNYGNNIQKVLNFGCGTGKHDIALAKCGGRYRCSGVDLSPLMIDIARENAAKENVQIEFSVADIRSIEIKERYDAVISLFHVMSYQNENDDVLAAFRSARKALEKGGIFLFDAWYGPGVLTDRPTVRIKETEDSQKRLVRIARPVMYDKRNVVDVCYEVLVIDKESGKTEMIEEVHSMRYFFRPELEYFLKEAGFELLDNLDCHSLGETDFGSWTSYFVARAR